jgi:hypothetical protein
LRIIAEVPDAVVGIGTILTAGDLGNDLTVRGVDHHRLFNPLEEHAPLHFLRRAFFGYVLLPDGFDLDQYTGSAILLFQKL